MHLIRGVKHQVGTHTHALYHISGVKPTIQPIQKCKNTKSAKLGPTPPNMGGHFSLSPSLFSFLSLSSSSPPSLYTNEIYINPPLLQLPKASNTPTKSQFCKILHYTKQFQNLQGLLVVVSKFLLVFIFLVYPKITQKLEFQAFIHGGFLKIYCLQSVLGYPRATLFIFLEHFGASWIFLHFPCFSIYFGKLH